MPLNEEIQKLTGLNDELLRGRAIDWQLVGEFFQRSALYVAHNAAFDRAFVQSRFDELGIEMPGRWACSMKHIDWEKHGFRTRALNYLAADHGFVNPFAHRAMFDCATTLRVCEPYFEELCTRSYLREYKLLAQGAPFETKDILKRRKYRWDPEQRVWYKVLLEDRLQEERDFLEAEIYAGRQASFVEEEISVS